MQLTLLTKSTIPKYKKITDPSYLWIPDFYKKFGFVVDNLRGTNMILEE